MEQLKRNRKCQRAQATKLINQLTEFEKSPDYRLKLNSLKVQLQLKREELKKLDSEIAIATESDGELAKEVDTAESYQFNLIEGIQRINLFLEDKEEKTVKIRGTSDIRVSDAPLTARLPKLELPRFTGNIIQWTSFWQAFEATIHNRKDLSQIEKLNYLISLLQEDAAQAVEGFALTAENYDDIIKLLKDRYGNTEQIVEHHIRKLLSLKPVKEISNLSGLRKLLTEISSHIRTLKNLKMPPSEIFNTKIKELFPDEIMLLYERQKKDVSSTDDLMDFLQKEMQVREKVKPPTVLDPNANIFKPLSNAPQTLKAPQFFVPRSGSIRNRPWVPRVPSQRWIPRTPTQQQSNRPMRPVVPPAQEFSRVTCYRCGRTGHYSRDCRSQASSSKSPDQVLGTFKSAEDPEFVFITITFPETGESILCVLDTGSTVTVIPKHFLNKLIYKEVETDMLRLSQIQGRVYVDKQIEVSVVIGNLTKNITAHVVDTHLNYILLSLQHMILFNLELNLKSKQVYQEGKIVNFNNVDTAQIASKSYHVNSVYDLNTKTNESKQKDKNVNVDYYSGKSITYNFDNYREKMFGVNSVCISEECNGDVNYPQQQQQDGTLPNLSEFKNPLTIQENLPESVNVEQAKELASLVQSFENIFSKDKYDIGCIRMEPAKVRLTSEIPISLRPYRASQKDNIEIKNQIDELLKHDIIKPSHSPYSSPVTLAYKRGEGKTRLCVDFRKINAICKTDKEPIPRIDEILDQLSQAKIFSTLDIASAYWNIALEEKSKEKLAFTCNYGLYEFQVLPYGYKNSPAIFQRTMRQILSKYQVNFALNYFDDLVVFSNNFNEHCEHLKILFQICEKENFKLKFSKCQLAQTKISFLGYEIGEGKCSPNNVNIETIKKLIPPKNVKQLQRFLGSVNVYNKFIRNYAKLRKPLNNLLKKDMKWNWDEECQNAYEKLKNSLISKPVLSIYNPNYPCSLYVDASSDGIGSVLKQEHPNGVMHPVAYHSRALRPYEKNYSVSELECLAIVDSVDKFHCYLHGTTFTIYTDHAALVWLKSIKHLTGRLFRWSLKLSMYDYTIKYKKGATNYEADFLSRQPISHFVTTPLKLLTLEEIKEHQQLDNVSHPKFKKVNNVLTIQKKGLTKIVVPNSLRLKLMENAHVGFGHPGIQKMLQILSPMYYWDSIIMDISNYVKFCEVCQLNKKCHQKRFGLLQSLPPAKSPFDLMSIDSVGGLGYYHSTKRYLHCIIDHSTRYIWSFASKHATTESYINCLKQIFQIAKPKKLLSDRNAAFTSTKFKHFLKKNGVIQLLTSSHRPQCNGKLERLNSTIVQRLRCKINAAPSNTPWPKFLEEATNEYNNTPHQVTSFPPNYLLFGKLPCESPIPNMNLYPPVEQAREIAYDKTIKDHEKNKVRYDKRYVESSFKEGDTVMVENFVYPNTRKLTAPFDGPYKIIRKISNVTFEINKPNYLTKKKTDIIHSTRLRFFNSAEDYKLVQRSSKIPINSLAH